MDTLTLIVRTILVGLLVFGIPTLAWGFIYLVMDELGHKHYARKVDQQIARQRAMRRHPAGKSL